MSRPNEQYKPNIGNILPRDILTRIKVRLIRDVFTIIENNRIVAWNFEQQEIITTNEVKNILEPKEEQCNLWTNKFIELITASGDIADCIWRLCDPETSGVLTYSTNIRNIIAEEFPTVTFPGRRSVDTPISSRRPSEDTPVTPRFGSTTETNPFLDTQSSPDQTRDSNNRNSQFPNKICESLTTMGVTVVVCTLLTLLVIKADISDSQLTHVTSHGNVPPIGIEEQDNATTYNGSLENPSSDSENRSNSISNIFLDPIAPPPEQNPTTPAPVPIPRTSSTEVEMNDPPTQKPIKRISDIQIDSASLYAFLIPLICNESLWTRITMSSMNTHEFDRIHFSCASRIDGLIFLDCSIHIDQIASLLQNTSQISYLKFDGPSICTRNEGFRSSSLTDGLSLEKLTHLEFNDLIGTESNVDCTSVFSWFASNKIYDLAPKVLSFGNVVFNAKNKDDVHELLLKVLRKKRLKTLNMTNVQFNDKMFNMTMNSRKLPSVILYAKNYNSRSAKTSLFNLINNFLYYSTLTRLETNVPLSLKAFEHSLSTLDSMGVKRLKLPVYYVKCESVNFNFLSQLPKVKTLEIKLIFPADCKKQSESSPIVFHGFEHLGTSPNYDEVRIISNVNFVALNAANFTCREYDKKSRWEFTLNRVPNCKAQD